MLLYITLITPTIQLQERNPYSRFTDKHSEAQILSSLLWLQKLAFKPTQCDSKVLFYINPLFYIKALKRAVRSVPCPEVTTEIKSKKPSPHPLNNSCILSTKRHPPENFPLCPGPSICQAM